MSVDKFGVEIEFDGAYKKQVALQLGEALGIGHVHCFGYKKTKCDICKQEIPVEELYDNWSVMTETTVGGRVGEAEIGGEVISPILTLDTIDTIKVVTDVLRSCGAKTNLSTGLHVHIGVRGLLPEQRANILRAWFADESSFFDRVAEHRYTNSHCAPYKSLSEQNAIIKEMSKPGPNLSARLSAITSSSRSLNVLSYPRLGTFEVRVHHGTFHYPTIVAWVQDLLVFVNMAAQRI